MTPEQYRAHPRLCLAFRRGERGFAAGLGLDENPYLKVGAVVKARRGSWTEAYANAWAAGFKEAARAESRLQDPVLKHMKLAGLWPAAPPAPSGEEE